MVFLFSDKSMICIYAKAYHDILDLDFWIGDFYVFTLFYWYMFARTNVKLLTENLPLLLNYKTWLVEKLVLDADG